MTPKRTHDYVTTNLIQAFWPLVPEIHQIQELCNSHFKALLVQMAMAHSVRKRSL